MNRNSLRLYKESEESVRLLEKNKNRLNDYYSTKSSTLRKKEMLKKLIFDVNIISIARQIRLKVNRKKYVQTDGNEKYQNIVIENNSNITPDSKIAVYTCLVGEYDEIMEPLYTNPLIDYYFFTDQNIPEDSKWKKIDITNFEEYKSLTPIAMNRRIKMLSHEYLKNYDYTVYMDSTVQVAADIYPIVCNMGDAIFGVHTHASRDCIFMEGEAVLYSGKGDSVKIREQLNRYKVDGFPEHYGLFQNSIIIKNQKSDRCRRIMQSWWIEYSKDETRDQLSLPYVLWKNNIQKDEIKILGKDASNNTRFIIAGGHKKG